ncbi:DUF4347 domain-containing protein [Pseudidiomarina sp.]|uniref:DUF4347 domain-containing protein n=1 Tax=Pseudidiomarina sp. TaxID=2081707 RepID=UPI003A97E80B
MTAETHPREIVFVDSRVPQLEILLAAMRPGIDLVMLDGSRDGLAQIADYLGAHPGEQAVHIVSHGRAGGVELGNQWLDSDNLDAHADALARIGQSLAPDGDILFYGCNLAAGAVGAEFLDQLARATGVNVAASDDPTGSVRLGGDWQLESQAGSVDTLSVFTGHALLGYDATLGVASENFDGVGPTHQSSVVSMQVNGWTFSSVGSSDFTVDQSNIGGGGVGQSLAWNWNSNPTTDFSFKSTDGTNFKLESFVFGSFGGDTTVTIAGYRDNVLVVAGEAVDTMGFHAGPNISYSNSGTGYGTATFGSGYANVDEIKFSLSPGVALEIDDISISPVAVNPTATVVVVDSALKTGETSLTTFTFSEAVTGFTTADLAIPNGTLSSLSSNDGGRTWTATFTPNANTTDATNVIVLDMTGVSSLASSTPGVGTTNSNNFSVDTAAPTVTSVDSSTANGTYKAGDTVSLQVNFSEAVTVTGTPKLTLETGASDRDVNYVSGSGTSTLNFTYTVQAGDTSADLDYLSTTALALNGGTITDAAGNAGILTLATPGTAGSLGANKAVGIDGVAPSLASGSVPANATYGAGQNLDFTVSYDEAVIVNTGGGLPYIALTLDTGGTVQASYIAGSGTNTLTFRYTVGAGGQDANGIMLASYITLNDGTVRDMAGNDAATTGIAFGSTAGVLVDAAVPSVSSINRTGPATTNANSLDYAVSFSKAVTGVDAGDFLLTSSGTTSGTVTGVSGSGAAYIVTVASITGDGTLRLDLKSSGTGITDGTGNAIAAGFTSGQIYTIDNTVPAAPSAPDLAPASDSGTSSTDNVTRAITPPITGTAEANSTVTLYATDGISSLGSATANGSGNWSITSAPLIEGAHTLTTKATDAAGNISAASSGLDLTIDTTAPTLVSATVNGNQLLLTYTEASTLDALNLPAVGDFEVQVGGASRTVAGIAINAAAKTVTLTLATAVSAGQAVTVAYTDHTGSDDLNAIQDVAGNDVASFGAATATNLTPPPPQSPPTAPPTTTETVDGVVVERLTVTNPDGSTSQTIMIPVVEANRVEVVGNNALADIPLVSNSSGGIVLSAQVPTGYGLQVSGVGAPQNAGSALQQLIQQIEARTPAGSSSQGQLVGGVSSFLQGLVSDTPLLVQTIVPTTTAGLSAPTVPLVISGMPANVDSPVSALVIDTRSLPSGGVLQLDNVNFAALIGAVQVTGGTGSQTVWGDDAAQYIVLGADDDVLHGGGGDDTVGSKGGNDRIYGEAGNDTLFGGAGADRLHGGGDADTARFEGNRDDYIITQDYSVVTVQSKADPSDVDTLINVETLVFADREQAVAYASELDWIAGLYRQVLGRQADLDGIQYWARQVDEGSDPGDVALRFLDSAEAGKALSSGDTSATLNALYEGLLGRAADVAGKAYWVDRLESGMTLHDLAAGFMESSEMQTQNPTATEWSFLG